MKQFSSRHCTLFRSKRFWFSFSGTSFCFLQEVNIRGGDKLCIVYRTDLLFPLTLRTAHDSRRLWFWQWDVFFHVLGKVKLLQCPVTAPWRYKAPRNLRPKFTLSFRCHICPALFIFEQYWVTIKLKHCEYTFRCMVVTFFLPPFSLCNWRTFHFKVLLRKQISFL